MANECSRVEIEPTENGGFSVRTYYRQKPDSGGKANPATAEPRGYMEPKAYAFTTFAELSAFLGESFEKDRKGRVVQRQ